MFMCYMPFVFMGLFGIEKYFDKKEFGFLVLSSVLILTSSYFFSIPALICLFIYAIYLYLEKNTKFKFSSFIKTHLVLSWYFIISVMISSVLLLPSFKAILDNRFATAKDSIFTYLIPNVSFDSFLYSSYSMGLSAIFIISIIYLIFKNKKNTRFLAIVFMCLLCIPIFNYVLNGFMYLNGKVLIPFIPLGVLLIGITLEDLLINKEKISKLFIIFVVLISILGSIHYSLSILYILDISLVIISLFLSRFSNKSIILIIVLAMFSVFNCLRINIRDNFIDNTVFNNQYDSSIKELFKSVNKSSIDRTVDTTDMTFNANNIRDINEYKTTMYSSITNKYYKDFYWNTFDTDNPSRNDAIFGDITNSLFNIYFGNRYFIGDEAPIGYKLINSNEEYNLFENSDVFSIGYVNNNLMSLKDFEKLDYPYSVEALMKYTIVDEDVSSSFSSSLKEIDIDSVFDNIKENYSFSLDNDKTVNIKPNVSFENKIVIVKFSMNYSQDCSLGDTSIKINEVRNTLTCRQWKYHNNNYSFTYVLSEQDDFIIEVLKGKYDISDIKMYTLDYSEIKNINSTHSNFVIDPVKTKGDTIVGSVNVLESGYFNLSIPYDKGYNIYVDGKEVSYQKVNKSFIGFKIKPGNHDIMIKYTASWLKLGEIVSIIGLCLLIVTIFVNKGVKRHEKNINGSTLL